MRVGGNIQFRDIYYHPIQLRAPLRTVFEPLLEEVTAVFAGREEELAELVRSIQQPAGGYLVVTAPAGFGKTALAAALVGSEPAAFAYHFFSPAYVPESISEDFFLGDVVEQMAEWHGRRGELPTELPELKALYHELLGEPSEQSRVLVLDGLDEVGSRWDVGSYIGRRLPPRSHVILTVRDVGQDWMSEYGLPADQTQHLSLGGLSREELGAVLRAAGPGAAALTTDAVLLEEARRVTAYEENPTLGADPFYARVLAEDIAAGRMEAADIGLEPPGLANYLDKWWGRLRETAGEGPAGDLFGVLTVALGRLRRDELETICPGLKGGWAGDLFEEEILPRVRRFLVGNDETGYALVHPRLRAYMRTRIRTLPAYRSMLLAFCADWSANRSRYAFAHFAEHFAEYPDDAQERAQLFALADRRDWYEAKLADDPSGASYLEDIGVAWRIAASANATAVAHNETAPLLAREVLSALVTSSLRSLSRSVPSRLLVALIRAKIWDPDQAIALVRQNPHSGARGRTLAALAPYLPGPLLEDALSIAQRIDDATDRGQALVDLAPHLPAPRATELLETAVETVRDDDDDDSIGLRVTVLLDAAEQLPSGPAEAALAAAVTLARTSDRGERAGILVQIADADTGDRRDGLIEEALSLTRFVPTPEARAEIATSVALLAPDRALDLAQETLEIAHASLDPAELVSTLVALRHALPRDLADEALEEALEVADAIDDPEDRARLLDEVAEALPSAPGDAILRRAIAAVRRIDDAATQAAALGSLAAVADGSEQAALVAEAAALARDVDTKTDQARILRALLGRVPETHYGAVLDETLAAARGIEQEAGRASALIWLALDLEPDEGDVVLHEAFRIGGAMDAVRSVESDEAEFTEAVARIAPHLAAEQRSRVIDETLAAARTIERLYDRARALAALVPQFDENEALERAQEALDTARQIGNDAERAEVLSSLVPYLPDPLRLVVIREASAAVRAVDEKVFSVTGTVSEDGIVELDSSPFFAGLRARVLPALAPYVPESEGERLVTEALDSVYEIGFQNAQAEALAALAPKLSEQATRRVLADLRAVGEDGLRADATSSLLVLTAEREGADAARAAARATLGDSVPTELLAALAPGRARSEPLQALHDAEVDETAQGEPDEHSGAGSISFDISVGDDFMGGIYRLAATPAAAFEAAIALDPAPDDHAVRASVEEEVLRAYVSADGFQPEQADVRRWLASAHDFRNGAKWTTARTALLRRLAELGSADSAFAEAEAPGGGVAPLPLRAALAAYVADSDRSAFAAAAAREALAMQDDDARIAVLSNLIPLLDGRERVHAIHAVESASRRIAAEADSLVVVSRLTELLDLLPTARRLRPWQEIIHIASADIRREVFGHLPALLALVEPLDGSAIWSETADGLLEIRRRWA